MPTYNAPGGVFPALLITHGPDTNTVTVQPRQAAFHLADSPIRTEIEQLAWQAASAILQTDRLVMSGYTYGANFLTFRPLPYTLTVSDADSDFKVELTEVNNRKWSLRLIDPDPEDLTPVNYQLAEYRDSRNEALDMTAVWLRNHPRKRR